MCDACSQNPLRRLAKESDAERSARETFLEEFNAVLEEWHSDLLTAIRDGTVVLATREAARRTTARVLDQHRDALEAAFAGLWEDGAEAGRAATARRYDLDVDDELTDRVRRELQEYAADAAEQTGSRMTDDIAEALRDAHSDGLSRDEIAEILQEDVFPDMRGYEADRAARTAATGSSARGAVSSIRDAGAPGKQWLVADDLRTRDSHDDIDGQVVPVGGKFTTGKGNQAWWPGDPRLPPSDFINCRCAVAPAWDT